MIYKTYKNIKKINNLIKEIDGLFKKKLHIFPLGSFVRHQYKYITDVDIQLVLDPKKDDLLEYFYGLLDFMNANKNIIFEYLKIEELSDKYLKEHQLTFKEGENMKKNEYRRWEKEEVELGIKLDHDNNFMFLDETINHLFHSNEKIIYNFFYKLDSQTYVPVSICIYGESSVRDMYKIYKDYVAKKDYTHAYKALNTYTKMLQNQYNLNEIDLNNLLNINNNYSEKIFDLNFLSSIKTQVELIGLIDNYNVNINHIISNLYKVILNAQHFSHLKYDIYKIKKSKKKYLERIEDINKILANIYDIINKNFKKDLESDSKIVEGILRRIKSNKITAKKMTKKKKLVINKTKKN